MSEQQQAPQTVNPNHLVIERQQTAKDLFLMAMRGNPANLATAASVKPGDIYTLNITIGLNFTREDTLAMLKEGGFEVVFPEDAANEGAKP